MKTTLMLVLTGAAVIMSGCATSQPCDSCTSCKPASSGQSATYDPVKNVTIISNNGNTWMLRGNVTNLILYPEKDHSP